MAGNTIVLCKSNEHRNINSKIKAPTCLLVLTWLFPSPLCEFGTQVSCMPCGNVVSEKYPGTRVPSSSFKPTLFLPATEVMLHVCSEKSN